MRFQRASRPFAVLATTLGAALLLGGIGSAAGASVRVDPTTTTSPTTTAPPTTAPPTTAPPTTAPPAPAPPAPPAPVVNYLPLTGPTLKSGSRGNEVWLMQFTLLVRGFWLQDGRGSFGASTVHALTAFQKAFGLPRSGRLDPKTRFVLGANLARVVPRTGRSGRTAEVDISRQILIVSDGNVSKWIFDISSGKASTKTPKGSFRIQREVNGQRISKLGQLWRPKYFTGGYALHGSPSVPSYPASHGCVRLTNQEIDYIWDAKLIPVGTALTLY